MAGAARGGDYTNSATGNYNATTARFYTDLGLLTCRTDFGEDASALFNLLTGICQFQGTRKLLVAPFELHGRMLRLIHRETANAKRGLPARIASVRASLGPSLTRGPGAGLAAMLDMSRLRSCD